MGRISMNAKLFLTICSWTVLHTASFIFVKSEMRQSATIEMPWQQLIERKTKNPISSTCPYEIIGDQCQARTYCELCENLELDILF